MKRYCQTLKLKDNNLLISKYVEIHKEVWPEIIEGIKEVGITNMQIYLRNNSLFMIVETKDEFDWKTDNERLSKLPYQAEWEEHVAQFQECKPGSTSSEKWQMMDMIFNLQDEKNSKQKKVFVSGCFDMLHSGHVAFFEEAAKYGDLYVGIGSDKTLFELKGKKTIYSEQERLFMVKSIKHVKDAWISKGSGKMDFVEEFKKLSPDIFFVNSDGDMDDKRELCEQCGVEYKVSERVPSGGLTARSTSDLRKESFIPYRLDLAGGWLDQPKVSKFYPGPVITVNIEPDRKYNKRSGLSTSSREAAEEMWGCKLPNDSYEKIAKMIFRYENPPGRKYVSGSQDAIGIVFPGLNLLEYNNDYWPYRIQSVTNDDIIDFVEKNLWFLPLEPRKNDFDVLSKTNINKYYAKALSDAAYSCWDAIMSKDISKWGKASIDSFNAQIAMFPLMVDDNILSKIEEYSDKCYGWKLSGSGGGGYLIFISDKEIEGAFQVHLKKD